MGQAFKTVWSIIGGFAGLARIVIASLCVVALFFLFVIPAERADATKGKVDEFRAVSAESERDELKRQVHAGQIVIDAYQVQLRNSRAREEASAAVAEQRISSYEQERKASGRRCDLTDDDVKFLLGND